MRYVSVSYCEDVCDDIIIMSECHDDDAGDAGGGGHMSCFFVGYS